jgi:hemerythrin
MNKLHEEARVRAAKTVLAKILEALARVTPKHFADEEVYMESIAFPCLTSHR